MNILPLISCFILLFAISSYSFIHSYRASGQEEHHFKAVANIRQQFIATTQNTLYKTLEGKNLHPNEKSDKEVQKREEYKWPRDQVCLPEEGKCNIVSLLSGDKKLEAIVIDMLRRLYEHTSIYRPNLEIDILFLIKEVAQPGDTFEEIFQKLPREKDLFYKLIKGTNTYILFTDTGYPALPHFFRFNTEAKPIHFRFASRALLQSLFNSAIAGQICLKEKEKYEEKGKTDALTIAELEQILLDNQKNLSDVRDLLSFSRKKTETEILLTDSTKKLSLRQK